jgi:L-ascorbate metabolism protein UlaG (beta-lactamase superfamily)
LEIGTDGQEARGVRFHAIRVFETAHKEAEDEVTILHFRSEGLHVVHLGDLGHSLSEQEVAPLRGADVLFASAGGPPTIDYPEIPPLIDAIDPRIIVPMHYKTPRINLNIQPVERFFEVLPEWPVERANSASFEVNRNALPASRRVVWLDHAR